VIFPTPWRLDAGWKVRCFDLLQKDSAQTFTQGVFEPPPLFLCGVVDER